MRLAIIVMFLVGFVNAFPKFDDNCVVTDFKKVSSAVKTCSNLVLSGITVPAGKQLDINLKESATLTFRGHFKFGFKNWDGPLINIRGKNVTVKGEPGHLLDGEGDLYWDGKGTKGSKKPMVMFVHTTDNSLLENINIKNCPVRCVAVHSTDTVFNNWNIDVSLGDTKGGHNTDGFDISHGKNLQFKNMLIKNQDDCVAINSGSDLYFDNFECHGCHGLSLSVGMSKNNGEDNSATNIYFNNSKVINSDNAIHIKTHPKAGTGQISNVHYENIEVSGIRNYGISIEQDYENKGNLTANIPIKGLYFSNITGTMVNKTGKNVYIACASEGCDNWDWSDVSITGGTNECNYQPKGFTC